MDETSFNGEAAVEAGSAAVCHGARTRPLNCSHPFSGIVPIKRCIKTVLLVQYVSFLHRFPVWHWHVLWPGLFSWRLKKKETVSALQWCC